MIFGVKKIWHENLTDWTTSPVRCNHFTLENPSHFNSTIHTHFWLIIYVIAEEKQTVTHLPISPENVAILTGEILNFFIWLKVCCVLSNVGGSEKNRLWCVETRMSGKQRYSKCSKLPPSAWIHASSVFATDTIQYSFIRSCQNAATYNDRTGEICRKWKCKNGT